MSLIADNADLHTSVHHDGKETKNQLLQQLHFFPRLRLSLMLSIYWWDRYISYCFMHLPPSTSYIVSFEGTPPYTVVLLLSYQVSMMQPCVMSWIKIYKMHALI